MQVIHAHDRTIDTLCFSPDGNLLASAGRDGVRVHAPPSGERLEDWPGGLGWVPLAFMPDGKWLARGGKHGIRISPVGRPGRAVRIRFQGYCSDFALSPDGAVVVTNSLAIRRWRTDTGEELPGGWGGRRGYLDDGRSPGGGVAFSPDGGTLATANGDLNAGRYESRIHLWDATSGRPRGTVVGAFANEYLRNLAFSPDGAMLAAVCGPHLRAWDTAVYGELATRTAGPTHFTGQAFTPDGRHLVTANNDRTARVWDTSTWAEVAGYEWKIGKLRAVAVSPDGSRIAAGDTGKVVIWDNDL